MRFFLLFSFLLSPFSLSAQKYIFYFIGDGFGVGALTYCENMAKEKGDTLCFTQFPVTGFITTHSADNLVTCSAAAATALASGEKTKNGKFKAFMRLEKDGRLRVRGYWGISMLGKTLYWTRETESRNPKITHP